MARCEYFNVKFACERGEKWAAGTGSAGRGNKAAIYLAERIMQEARLPTGKRAS